MARDSHPIRNSVIGGLILTAVLGEFGWLPDIFSAPWAWTKSVASWIWSSLFTHWETPVWLHLAYLALALPTLIRLATRLAKRREDEDWKRYTEDLFEGVCWRWGYNRSGRPSGLRAFCPRDDTELTFAVNWLREPKGFHCDTCGRQFSSQGQPEDYTVEAAIRRIERNIRTGTWKARVQAGDQECGSAVA